jgi:lysophospholipase L1-like esterase
VVATAWTILGLTLLSFIIFNSCFSLAFMLKDSGNPDPAWPAKLAAADAYRDAPWAQAYFEEFDASYHLMWQPYIYWRRMPYRGKYINIAGNGRRYTVLPDVAGPPTAHRLPKIFVFGGSTVWGTGARDSGTIPSRIAAEMYQKGIPVDVTNMGETGYVSTQELISLELELRKGNLPDLVVFYDGVNDTFAAYQQREAGIPQNEFNRAKEFNLTQINRRNDLRYVVLQEELHALSMFRFVRGAARRLGLPAARRPATDGREERARLADQVVSLYKQNIKLASALADKYGFHLVAYWQPTILDKKRQTPYEAKIRAALSANLADCFDQTYQSMRREARTDSTLPAVNDISNIFADVSEPIFIDSWHLGERGNQMVAERIAQNLSKLLPKAP